MFSVSGMVEIKKVKEAEKKERQSVGDCPSNIRRQQIEDEYYSKQIRPPNQLDST